MNIIWIVSFKLTFRYVVTELFLNFILSFLKYSMVRVLVENLNWVMANREVKKIHFFLNQGLEPELSYS